jgi:hypothetical protein
MNVKEIQPHQPWLAVYPDSSGGLAYDAVSSTGAKVKGKLPPGKWVGQVIHPGWKGDVKVTVEEWLPDAIALTQYKTARVQYGNQAPTSWLGRSGRFTCG